MDGLGAHISRVKVKSPTGLKVRPLEAKVPRTQNFHVLSTCEHVWARVEHAWEYMTTCWARVEHVEHVLVPWKLAPGPCSQEVCWEKWVNSIWTWTNCKVKKLCKIWCFSGGNALFSINLLTTRAVFPVHARHWEFWQKLIWCFWIFLGRKTS